MPDTYAAGNATKNLFCPLPVGETNFIQFSPKVGGINLETIKAQACFYVEERA